MFSIQTRKITVASNLVINREIVKDIPLKTINIRREPFLTVHIYESIATMFRMAPR